MPTLYEIKQEYLEAIESLQADEETGEVLNFEALEAITEKFEEKAENLACYIKNQAALVDAMKKEEAALAKRRRQEEKKIENMQGYLTSCMDAVGKEKMESARCKVSFRKSASVNIEDLDSIPVYFLSIEQLVKPDKLEIKKALQAGQIVQGAALIESRNIQIR